MKSHSHLHQPSQRANLTTTEKFVLHQSTFQQRQHGGGVSMASNKGNTGAGGTTASVSRSNFAAGAATIIDDEKTGNLEDSLQTRQVVLGPPSHVLLSRPRLLKQSLGEMRQKNTTRAKQDLKAGEMEADAAAETYTPTGIAQNNRKRQKMARSFTSFNRSVKDDGTDSNNATTLMLDRTFAKETHGERQSVPASPNNVAHHMSIHNDNDDSGQQLSNNDEGHQPPLASFGINQLGDMSREELRLQVKKLNTSGGVLVDEECSPVSLGSPAFRDRTLSMQTKEVESQPAKGKVSTKKRHEIQTLKKTSAHNLTSSIPSFGSKIHQSKEIEETQQSNVDVAATGAKRTIQTMTHTNQLQQSAAPRQRIKSQTKVIHGSKMRDTPGGVGGGSYFSLGGMANTAGKGNKTAVGSQNVFGESVTTTNKDNSQSNAGVSSSQQTKNLKKGLARGLVARANSLNKRGAAGHAQEKKPNFDLDHVQDHIIESKRIFKEAPVADMHTFAQDSVMVLNLPTEAEDMLNVAACPEHLQSHDQEDEGEEVNDAQSASAMLINDDVDSSYKRGPAATPATAEKNNVNRNSADLADPELLKAKGLRSETGDAQLSSQMSKSQISGANGKTQSVVSPQFVNGQIILLSDHLTIKEQTSGATADTLLQLQTPSIVELTSKVARNASSGGVAAEHNQGDAAARPNVQLLINDVSGEHDKNYGTAPVPAAKLINGRSPHQTGIRRNGGNTEASTFGGASLLVNDKNGSGFRRESGVQFAVQPRQNALVTANHPIFMNQIQKLQQQKQRMEAKAASAILRKQQQREQPMLAGSGLAAAQNPSLRASQNPLDQFSQDTTMWIESHSMHQIDPRQVIKQPAQVNARRCTTSFQIKREQPLASTNVAASWRRDSTQNSVRSSNLTSGNQAGPGLPQQQQPAQLKDSVRLPFQFKKSHQGLQVKKRLNNQQQDPAMLLVGAATGKETTALQNLVDVLTQKKQAYAQELNRTKRSKKLQNGNQQQTRNQARKTVLSQEETLRMQHHSEENNAPRSAPLSDEDKQSESDEGFMKSSFEMQLRESNDKQVGDKGLKSGGGFAILHSNNNYNSHAEAASTKKSRSRQTSSIQEVNSDGNQKNYAAGEHEIKFSSFHQATIPLVQSHQLSSSAQSNSNWQNQQRSDQGDTEPDQVTAAVNAASPEIQGKGKSQGIDNQPFLVDPNSTVHKADYTLSSTLTGRKNENVASNDANNVNQSQVIPFGGQQRERSSINTLPAPYQLRSQTPNPQDRENFVNYQELKRQGSLIQPAPQVTISIQRKPIATPSNYTNNGEVVDYSSVGFKQDQVLGENNNSSKFNKNQEKSDEIEYQVSEAVVNQFTDEQLPSEFQRQKTSIGHLCHIQRLHQMYKRARPLSQNFHRRHNNAASNRLQQVYNQTSNARVKVAPWMKLMGTPFASSQREDIDHDKHHVLSGGAPQTQYGEFIGEFGTFNLAATGEDSLELSNNPLQHEKLAGLLTPSNPPVQPFVIVNGSCLLMKPDSAVDTARLENESIISRAGGNHDNNITSSPIGQYSFKPSILHQLKKDAQFKQAFRGLLGPQRSQKNEVARAVSSGTVGGGGKLLHSRHRTTLTSQMGWSGKISPSRTSGIQHPAEIKYERHRKGYVPAQKNEAAEVRSLRASQTLTSNGREKSKNNSTDYQLVMHVPSKRVSTAAGSSAITASNPNHFKQIRQNRQEKKRQLMKSSGRTTPQSQISVRGMLGVEGGALLKSSLYDDYGTFRADGNTTECLITEDCSYLQQRKHQRLPSSISQYSPTDSNFKIQKKQKKKQAQRQSTTSSQIAINLSKNSFNPGAPIAIAAQETVIDQPAPPRKDDMTQKRDRQIDDTQPSPEKMEHTPVSLRRTIELNYRTDQGGGSNMMIDSVQEGESASQLEALQVNTAALNNKKVQKKKQSQRNKQAEASSYVHDESHDLEICESSDMRTMRLSNESLPREYSLINQAVAEKYQQDQGTTPFTLNTLNTNKLWLKHIIRKPAKQASKLSTQPVSSSSNLVNVFLNQTLKKITATNRGSSQGGASTKSKKSATSSTLQQQQSSIRPMSQQMFQYQQNRKKAQPLDSRTISKLAIMGRQSEMTTNSKQWQPHQLASYQASGQQQPQRSATPTTMATQMQMPKLQNSPTLKRVQENVLKQQIRSQRRQSQIRPEEISTTPVSPNQNLIRNRKSNNLSSYAHPRNAQIQRDDETEIVQL